MNMDINYELVAMELANAMPWDVSAGKVERVAQAVLKVYRRPHTNANITTPRAQTVFDYVLSLRDARLEDTDRQKRLVEFIYHLAPDGSAALSRLLDRTRPQAGPSGPVAVPDFTGIVHDYALVELLIERWKEANACIEQRAFLGATILMGSLLEGLLLAKAMSDFKAAYAFPSAPRTADGKPRPLHDWALGDLIDAAGYCGWLQNTGRGISQSLREYRNIIHPWHQLADGVCTDENSCQSDWDAVRAAVKELTG